MKSIARTMMFTTDNNAKIRKNNVSTIGSVTKQLGESAN